MILLILMVQRIGIYGAIVAFTILITMIKGVFAYVTCLNASRNLHNKMFRAILRTPIIFFDTNPLGMLTYYLRNTDYNLLIILLNLGCILNRFSADIGQMDSCLPKLFFHFFNVSSYRL